MNEVREFRFCDCGYPERWANDPLFPVEFHGKFNEYSVVRSNGMRHIMRFCFWCGGRLPESTRGAYFTTPDESEMQDALRILQGAKTILDVEAILGKPDQRVEGDQNVYTGTYPTVEFVTQFKYTRRWTTLDLNVIEVSDRSITYLFTGKYVGGGAEGTEQAGNGETPNNH